MGKIKTKKNLKNRKQETQNLAELKSMTAIELIEKIVKMADNCQLTQAFFKKVTPYLQLLASKQGISEMQALFLSLCGAKCVKPRYGHFGYRKNSGLPHDITSEISPNVGRTG